jgi:hypothetical protein
MSPFRNVTSVFLDTILMRLVPWFLTAAEGCVETARQAALSMLASYNVETEEEIRLAAEIASFGLSALTALSSSFDPDLSLNVVLRLRGSANALHRSAHQCQRTLDKLRKERLTRADAQQPEQTATPDEAPSPQSRPTIPLSRQQRRAMERAVEKAKRSQVRQAPCIGNPPRPEITPYDQLLAA